MKYILLILTILAFSCSNQNSKEAGKMKEKNILKEIVPPPPPSEKINRNDKQCLTELEKAKADAKNGVLVYSLYGMGNRNSDEELEELLKKFNIVYKPLGPNCTGELNCYGLYMDSLITEKYGKTFISSLNIIADHMFELDMQPIYYGGSPDTTILMQLTFPEDWDFKSMKYERQYIDAELVVDTLGKLSNIKIGEFSYNLKNTNEKHLRYLKKEIKRIIEQMKPWKPAELNGHKVKCWYLVDINLDK